MEKLRYNHRNPVKRGLVAKPEDWRWSSFLQWATGGEGTVEIECPSTALKRERMGIALTVLRIPPCRKERDKGGATHSGKIQFQRLGRPTTAMTSHRIRENLNGKFVDWMKHVTDQHYRE